MRPVIAAITLLLAVLWHSETFAAQSLKGSRASQERMLSVAKSHDFTRLLRSSDVARFVELGLLVKVSSSEAFEVDSGVSYPVARPALKTFIERLGAQYRSSCGEKLVVTSLTRPITEQPRNASDISVHPAGMAVDLRVSRKRSCRVWLERVLLSLERRGVLEATREQSPPHFHVAVFPRDYLAYVAGLSGETRLARAEGEYEVRSGDSLWTIARSHDTTVDDLMSVNDLSDSKIKPGQILRISN